MARLKACHENFELRLGCLMLQWAKPLMEGVLKCHGMA